MAGRNAHVRHEHAEVRDVEPLRLEHSHRIRRGRRLESDTEENHVSIGVLASKLERVQRRVHDAHVTTLALHPEEVPAATGHAKHVAERAEDHVRSRCDLQRLVDELERRNAHRATRTVDHLDLVRNELVDAVPDDRMRLTAADLHDRPRLGDGGVDVVEQPLGELRVVELVEVFHSGASRPLSRAALGPRVAELLVELTQLPEQGKRLHRRLLVESLQCEPDMHDRVLTNLEVRHELQADILLDATEVDLRHPSLIPLPDVEHLARDG